MLLRARISLVRIRTQIKNKIHAIVDRNRDSYCGLENLTDIFGKTGKLILRDTKICPTDHKILTGYLDLMDEIDKKIKDIESQIDKSSLKRPRHRTSKDYTRHRNLYRLSCKI